MSEFSLEWWVLSIFSDVEEEFFIKVVIDMVDNELTSTISEPNQIVNISSWSAITNVNEVP